jgi:histidinol-phosphate aminotransferase
MSYLRPNIERMQAYAPGFQPQGEGWIKLNTNENPFPPSPRVMEALQSAVDGRLRLYPDPLADKVREKVGETYRVEKEGVIVGNGCDEVLAMAARAFLGEGRVLLMTRPTYTLYRVIGQIQGADIREVPLNDDTSLPEALYTQEASLTFLCNPNSPWGILHRKEEVVRLCEQSGGVVVIDEAYVDFASEDCLDLARKYDNVLVARSLSKYMALSGLRVGFAIGGRELIDGMMKVKDSYNVNCLSQVGAVAALQDIPYYSEKVKEICRERELLSEQLAKLGWKVFPSQANFVFALPAHPPASEIYRRLFQKKILVRYFDTPETKDALRITVGNKDENRRLLEAIQAITGGEQ